MNKLHRKDFSIAVKKGTDANKSKFAKEAVQGEMYYAMDSRSLYIANTSAGAFDSVLTRYDFTHPFNVDSDTEANILASTPTAPSGYATKMFGSDTGNFYIYDGSWYIYNKEPFSKYSLSFDGSNDHAHAFQTVLDSSKTYNGWGDQYQPISLTAWVKFLSFGGDRGIIGWYLVNTDGSYNPSKAGLATGFHCLSSKKLYMHVNGTQVNLPDTYTENVWYHLAMVYDGSNMVSYVDGSAVNTTASTSHRNITEYSAVFVGGRGRWNGAVNAKIDEVALFNKALTASEIQTVYNSGAPGSLESLSPVAWWRMGDGVTSGPIPDVSGNSNSDLSLFGGPTFSTDTPR